MDNGFTPEAAFESKIYTEFGTTPDHLRELLEAEAALGGEER